MKLKLSTLFFMSLLVGGHAFAASSKNIDAQDVDTLGGNQPLMGMAQALDPENKSRIVQRRIVDLNNHLEVDLGYGAILGGGDPYLTTQSFMLNLDYHINPHWALGLRYNDYGSALNSEGQRMTGASNAAVANGGTGNFVDTDAPQQSGIAVVEWSPFYGKINFFDQKVVQFDLYGVVGGGEIQLQQEGFTSMYTGGVGAVFWFAKRFSTRIETDYQAYKDQVVQQGGAIASRNINANLTSITFGILL